MVTVYKYARTVINQHDQQYTRNDWVNPEDAQGKVTSTSAKGNYTKVKSKYYKPHILYAYDFELSIPENAVITSLQYQVRIRATKGLDALRPIAVFNSYRKGVFKSDWNYDKDKGKTGDYGGMYKIVPTKKISSSYSTIYYDFPSNKLSQFEDIHYTFNQMGFGIQLLCQDANSTGTVHIEWIRVKVEYELPNRVITFEDISVDSENPTPFKIDVERDITITTINNSISNENDRDIQIVLPLGLTLVKYKLSGKRTSFNSNDLVWRVNGDSKQKNVLVLTVIPKASGFKQIRAFTNETRWYGGYILVDGYREAGFDEISLTPYNMRVGEPSCFDIYTHSQSHTQSYWIDAEIEDLQANDLISVAFDEDVSSYDVELTDYTLTNSTIHCDFNVPVDEEFFVKFKVCYYPRQRLSDSGTVHISTSNDVQKGEMFDVARAYEKHIIFNKSDNGDCTEKIEFTTPRIISQVDTDLDVLPIYVDAYDANMYVDESTFGLNQWKKSRYIGCVEVPYAHYEPKHTTKDKLLDEHYKNKEYIGKENAPDEDITLKVRVPRRKTPTLIGLMKIDRPIPINLVPDAFENDPLNHRGWAEYYSITVNPTNPLYDDCELEVKYITHNIISRFHIKHEGLVNQFTLPNVFTDSLNSGDEIGAFFDVITDGSYIYDEDDIAVHRNLFSFTNKQDILLRTKEPLAANSQFEFYWDTVLFDELRENKISRVIRLVDDKDRVIFEYEYYDFDFSEDAYSCRVIGRALTNNGYNSIINSDIYVHSDVEFTDDDEDEEYDAEAIDLYGSSVAFELNSNKLTVREKGFSGYEFEKKDISLLAGNYYLEVYWKNNNEDADTSNILNYFDFEVNELTYNNQLAEYYNKLVVSPYPVPYKKIVFTRESEEGTLYYLAIEEENEEFSFLLEPFYQYKCGVDLVAEGSSIFDFNNSYSVIYIQNGLIRFGINRLNGDLYLDKWDYQSKDYIRTNRFRIDKFDDAEVTTINDDIIVVNVSDITITMWRGRPYVMLQHEKEDIVILDTFNQVFSDGVGDNLMDYPIVWDLNNSDNLLPECVGGTQLLKSSCVTVTEEDPVLDDLGSFLIIPDKTECNVWEEVVCTINGNFESGSVSLVINEKVVGTNELNQIMNNEGLHPSDLYEIAGYIEEKGLNTIYAVYHGDDNTDIEVSNIVTVNAIEAENTVPQDDEGWKLRLNSSNSLLYNQGTVDFLLTYNGEPQYGYEVIVYNPHQTWHINTNAQGIVHSLNKGVPAGTHKWVASAYDNGEELDSTTVEITVKEVTTRLVATSLEPAVGKNAVFRITDKDKNPLENLSIDINIGGTKYVRKSNENGYFTVKMSKIGTYSAKVKYVGETGKYTAIEKDFTILVGDPNGA